MLSRSLILALVTAAMTIATAAPALAQLGANLTYDGRPTIVRLRYKPLPSPEGCHAADSPAGAGWGHDYPMSVQGLLTAVNELMSVTVEADSNLVLTIEDPEIMKHPVAMLTEPGCWNPTEAEAKALRTYLLKGAFLFVDDPTFGDASPEHIELAIERFETWIQRVLPGHRVVPIMRTDPLFDGFMLVDPSEVPGVGTEVAQVVGVYEDNDSSRRLLVIANYRTALGQFWRYVSNDIGSGIENGGAAYKLGLNYFIYGFTH